MSKFWKTYGIVLLAIIGVTLIINAVFFVNVCYHIEAHDKAVEEAVEKGFDDKYRLAKRLGTTEMEGEEYYIFESVSASSFKDEGYYFLVPTDDEFDDVVSQLDTDLELFGRHITTINQDGKTYTILDLYKIARCDKHLAMEAFELSVLCSFVFVAPVVLIAGVIWIVHFVRYRRLHVQK